MAHYKVSKSATTGWWTWSCGSLGGSEATKDLAQAAAGKACGGVAVITPPTYNATYGGGLLVQFQVNNLDNILQTYITPVPISEDCFDYFFGYDFTLGVTDFDMAFTILNIWGIYIGGTTEAEIKTIYNLTDPQFAQLIAKDYIDLDITIDGSNNYTWIFPV